MRTHPFLLTALLLSLTLAVFRGGVALAEEEFVLVENGEAKAVIVIPDQPVESVELAARELREHITASTGVDLRVVRERASRSIAKTTFLYLGDTDQSRKRLIETSRMQFCGARIEVGPAFAVIAGRDDPGPWDSMRYSSGTLFAVYDFLENELGVRWYWPGELGTEIPKHDRVVLPVGRRSYTPAFRTFRFRRYSNRNLKGWEDKQAKNVFDDAVFLWTRRHRFNADWTYIQYPHGFTRYWKEFGESDPEIFNLLPDGTRRPDPSNGGSPRHVTMCVSSPELHRIIVEKWYNSPVRAIRPFINCNENDAAGRCTCDRCMAWDDSEESVEVRRTRAKARFDAGDSRWFEALGSVSNRYARFCLAVLAEADRVAPGRHARVRSILYSNYSTAPDVELSERILLQYCPPVMFPWTEEKVAFYKENWAAAAETGALLGLRPNYFLDGHCYPIFFARKFADSFQFASKHSMINGDIDSMLKSDFATGGINLYTLARMANHPTWEFDQVLEEFLSAFGPAREEVGAYLAYLEEVSDAYTMENPDGKPEGGRWATFFLFGDELFTEEVFDRCTALLDTAAGAAGSDNTAAARVAFLRLGLDNARRTAETQKRYRAYQAGKIGFGAFVLALNDLQAFRNEHAGEFFADLGGLYFLESRYWPIDQAKALSGEVTQLPIRWKFAWDPEKAGLKQGWQRPDFDDAAWKTAEVTSAWENQPVGKAWKAEHGADYNGEAWYRISVTPPAVTPGKRLYLVFGAVDEACVVYINGKEVLDRPFPYKGDNESWMKPFEIDVTELMPADEASTIAVKVIDNSGAGGIWQSVFFKVSIPDEVAEEANLLKNPGFELGAKDWKINKVRGQTKLDTPVTQEAHSGKRCLRMEIIAPDGKQTAWARYFQRFPVEAGKRYRVRLWVKGSRDLDGHLWLWTRSGPTKGVDESTKNIPIRNVPTAWREVIKEFTPAADKASVWLNVVGNKGTLYVDDVQVFPLP
jgi:hypothetical protein